MSEAKAPRDTKTIQQEYNNLAFRAGNLQYTISEHTKDLAAMNATLRELNFEFVAAKETEEAAAKAATETAATEGSAE